MLKFAGQVFLLWVIYYSSSWIVMHFHIPLPGSVLGMIVLFTLLLTGIIREEWLTSAVNPLLRHLSFFFIPIAVELMEWGDLFVQQGALLFLPLVLSTLVALLVTGGVAQFLSGAGKQKGARNE